MTELALLEMILTLIVIGVTVTLYATERYSIEAISLGAIAAFLLIFRIFPTPVPGGLEHELIGPEDVLLGFANPALITVISLMITGQALFQTDALEQPIKAILKFTRNRTTIALVAILLIAGSISAVMNNTPVVVMFLPIIAAISASQGKSTSLVLMPLSFVTILGGMTTVIGSATNILVADVALRNAEFVIEFFSFTRFGLILAGIGLVYILIVMPFILRPRMTMAEQMNERSGRQFIAQIAIDQNHPLVGMKSVAGMFPKLKNMTVRIVQRGEQPILPPFEDVEIKPGDTIIFAATKATLKHVLSRSNSIIGKSSHDETDEEGFQNIKPSTTISLAEAVVAPGSSYIGNKVSQINLHSETGCIVIGIQRRSQMQRTAMKDISLEPGDVLLLAGDYADIKQLRSSRKLLLLDWSTDSLPLKRYSNRALLIFFTMVGLAASGLLPIVSAALFGCVAMVATNCLTIKQAIRAIDSRIYMLIGTSIAAGKALEVTGGADAIANGMILALQGQSPIVMLSALFLVVAILTNILSNSATAILFTPIAIVFAEQTNIPLEATLVCVIFAANCAFATPIGYQTNLIVYGPGHYQFKDFIRAGLPLVLLIWLSFTLIAPWYYGI